MTNSEKEQIVFLKRQGYGYKKISAVTGISANTIKSYFQRRPDNENDCDVCLCCGKFLQQTPHKKRKKFCSDKCRNAWWAAHPEMRKGGKGYEHICVGCKKAFVSARPGSRYCSVHCFAESRKKPVAV